MDQKSFPQKPLDAARTAGRLCRLVTALLLAGVTRHDFEDTEARLEAAPVRQQAMLVSGTLALLFAGAFLFAQAGFVGLLVYFFIVILLAR